MTNKAAFLDYYKENNIAPVAQDISDLQKHFQRREALYRQCGIVPSFLQGRSILEIGPGTGHNAIYTNSLGPGKYKLVDGNPTSCQSTAKLLSSYYQDLSNIEIVEEDVLKFCDDDGYDLVLCEGTIPYQIDPAGFTQHISRFVAPGGILVITTCDSISDLSEMLRKFSAELILDQHGVSPKDIRPALEILTPVFRPQLKNLQGMSRPVEDWVLDNILHPFIGEPFSILDAINALENEFLPFHSSPDFFSDWRWYKDIHGDQFYAIDHLKTQTRENLCQLIDYRNIIQQPISTQLADDVASLSRQIVKLVLDNSGIAVSDKAAKLALLLAQLLPSIKRLNSATFESIEEYSNGLAAWINGDGFPVDLPKFSPWFGRGQQYLSFIKKCPV